MISVLAEIATPLLTALTGILLTIGLYGMLRMLESLLARVPDAKQADAARTIARFLGWALPVAVILSIAGGMADSPDIWLAAIGMCGAFLFWIVLLAVSVRLSLLLFVASRHFKTALADARKRAESDGRAVSRAS